jgi:mono/diheme cytochrome c family protein/glucose/arabinose dehydrogenase
MRFFRIGGLGSAAAIVATVVSVSVSGDAEVGQASTPSGSAAQTVPPPGAPAPPAGRGRGRGAVEAPAANDPLNANADLSPKPPVLPLRPDEQAKRFWLPPGYRLEPVLADPVIDSPGQIAFDGNGRMFVAEMRGYEQTLDGIDVVPPVGRISVHEDKDADGVYEHHRVFVDKIVFPRFVMTWGANSVLTMETHQGEVWKYTDTDGDGTADKKELFTTSFGRPGNIEHQPSSLMWAMDNWMYSTYNSFRLRWTPGGLLREPTGANGGQWGISQDNHGKVWFQSGASGMPGYFQFPIHYGNFDVPDRFEPDLNITWGAPILLGDIQAGLPGTRLPDGSLIRATASAGSEIFRGDRLPQDLVGDYLYGEVVARSVRRMRPMKTEGLTQLQNVYPRSEFLRSVDPLFRPVDVAGAPDGTIYIADMYRGVIEGAPWARQGTYLRQKVDQYQLAKVVGYGRIWRLTYDGIARDRTQPRMLQETPAQLVAHLSHPNGWWRDTAQQLIVLKQDASVVPALKRLVQTSPNQLARAHALWTLEGLGALDAAIVREQMESRDPQMRIHAIRASETLYKAGDRSLASDWAALATDPDTDVAIQALLTSSLFKPAGFAATVRAAQAKNPSRGVQEIGRQLLQPAPSLVFSGRGGRGGMAPAIETTLQKGAAAYQELCATCHGADGRGTPIEGTGGLMAPPLLGSNRVLGHRDFVIKTLLHGLTGPVDGRNYGVMVPMGANSDEWVASIASYIRSGFGTSDWVIAPADVARVRVATAGRSTSWTLEELETTIPRPIVADASWKATASHNPSAAGGGTNFSGWSSDAPQAAGMWYQLELPAAVNLTEIQFESQPQGGGGGAPTVATYPRAFKVDVSADGRQWGSPVAERKGSGSPTTIAFAPARGKFIRITLTADAPEAPVWSLRNIRLLEAPGPAVPGR